jgi:hypothetical protein
MKVYILICVKTRRLYLVTARSLNAARLLVAETTGDEQVLDPSVYAWVFLGETNNVFQEDTVTTGSWH